MSTSKRSSVKLRGNQVAGAAVAVLLASGIAGCATQQQSFEEGGLIAALGEPREESEAQPMISGTELAAKLDPQLIRLSANDGQYLTWISKTTEDEYCVIVSPSDQMDSVSASCVPAGHVKNCGAWLSTVLPEAESGAPVRRDTYLVPDGYSIVKNSGAEMKSHNVYSLNFGTDIDAAAVDIHAADRNGNPIQIGRTCNKS